MTVGRTCPAYTAYHCHPRKRIVSRRRADSFSAPGGDTLRRRAQPAPRRTQPARLADLAIRTSLPAWLPAAQSPSAGFSPTHSSSPTRGFSHRNEHPAPPDPRASPYHRPASPSPQRTPRHPIHHLPLLPTMQARADLCRCVLLRAAPQAVCYCYTTSYLCSWLPEGGGSAQEILRPVGASLHV